MATNNPHKTQIVPVPLTSIVAARALHELEYIIDLIYVDSAHEKGETYAELVLFYDLLRKGGLICGDDYLWWEAVRHDVDLFRKGVSLPLLRPETPTNDQWCIQKPWT